MIDTIFNDLEQRLSSSKFEDRIEVLNLGLDFVTKFNKLILNSKKIY